MTTTGERAAAELGASSCDSKAFPDMRINCVDPGYTATDLNGNSGYLTPADAARIIVAMACIGPDGPTGTYRNADGDLPW